MAEFISLITDSLSRIAKYPYVILAGTVASIITYYTENSFPIAVGKGLIIAGLALLMLELLEYTRLLLRNINEKYLEARLNGLCKSISDVFFLFILGGACIKLNIGLAFLAVIVFVLLQLFCELYRKLREF